MSVPQTELMGVLTSIQSPTACVRRLAEVLDRAGAGLLVIGDRKGPAAFDLPPAELLTLDEQRRLPFRLAAQLPTDHYVRKNLGYLLAISRNARCIYETDDDNLPAESWRPRELQTLAQPVAARPWLNVYRLFTEQLIWPRLPPGTDSGSRHGGPRSPDTGSPGHRANPAGPRRPGAGRRCGLAAGPRRRLLLRRRAVGRPPAGNMVPVQ